jgi:hypothetical protein
MGLDPTSKLDAIREAMSAGEWERAIKLAAKFKDLGDYAEDIRRAKDAINNQEMYEQMGYDINATIARGVAALKAKYSTSWKAAQERSNKEADPD